MENLIYSWFGVFVRGDICLIEGNESNESPPLCRRVFWADNYRVIFVYGSIAERVYTKNNANS